MADGHAHFPDFAARQDMVAVIAGLGGQIERDGKAGLAFFEVRAIKRVGCLRSGVSSVGTDQPWTVAGGSLSHLGLGNKIALRTTYEKFRTVVNRCIAAERGVVSFGYFYVDPDETMVRVRVFREFEKRIAAGQPIDSGVYDFESFGGQNIIHA